MKNPTKSHKPRGLNKTRIRELYNMGWCEAAIARKFKCHINAVHHHIADLTIPNKAMIRTNAKLSDTKVKQIRSLAINHKISSIRLAKKFSVSETTILNVIRGRFYRHVPGKIQLSSGKIVTIPENFSTSTITKTIGRHKGGPNKYTTRLVPPGTLIPIAKKYGVATCTISRWIRKGIIHIPK